MLRIFTSLCLFLMSVLLFAQMPDDDIVRYGNEWIDYDKTYLRIETAADGIYQVTPAQLTAAGFTGTEDDWVLYHEGKMVPIEVTAGGIVFVGERNDGGMDRYLFPDPDALQLNDRFNMHTDTAAYYLTRGEGGLRYTEPTVSGIPEQLTSVLRKAEKIYGDYASKSFFRSGSSSIYYSHYDEAEGFGSRATNDLLSRNGDRSSVTELDLPGSNGGAATLDLRFGLAFDGHIVKIEADGNELTTITQSSWGVVQRSLPFTPTGEATTINVEGTRGDRDKPNLAWLEVTYPAGLAYDEDLTSFTVPAAAGAVRIVLTDLGAAAGAGGVLKGYASTSGTMFSVAVAADGTATIELPAANTDRTFHLAAGDDFRSAIASPRTFSTALPTNGNVNYLLLTSRRLHGPAVEDLASYRRSMAGGSYDVLVVDVEDLYDEFGYGINRHPMALRNYLAAARIVAPNLQYLFLVGKGREYEDLRRPTQLDSAYNTFFIPSFGYPASDNLLSADLGGVVPNLSTGRLSAVNEEEIAIYAKKLRDVEAQINTGGQTIAERDWMKQVMHLGGGGTPGEQSSIKTRLGTMETSARGASMAANVSSFFKTSSEPIEDSRQEAIFARINSGLSVLTFMGHSSSQTFDFSIDDPANYNNSGKYPFMISLGCYSGDAFTEERSISERFIFLRDKGAIAFAASKGVGYISALGNWGNDLYKSLGTERYGEGIGDALRHSIENFSSTSNFTLSILLEQFALSGDPAYRMHPRPGPDLVIDLASISFEPEIVPAQDPTYRMTFDLLNLGLKPTSDSVTLRFRQQLPNGEIVDLTTSRFATPNYRSAYQVELLNPGIRAVGNNRVLVSVDSDDDISELPTPEAEANNELTINDLPGIPLTFVANTARAAFPPEYAVIGGQLEFISSTTNVLAPPRDYIFQVSSGPEFNNLLVNETINSPGGIIRYTPNFSPVDSTTYYWRISPDSASVPGVGYIWSESSLTWLADREFEDLGWAVQDAGQTIDGEFKNILARNDNNDWNFAQTITDIRIINGRFTGNRQIPRFEWNGQVFDTSFPWHTRAGIQIIVIDSTNNSRWEVNTGGGIYGTVPFSGRADPFSFDTKTQAGRAAMMSFIEDVVEPGKYVLLYSAQRGNNANYVNEDWLMDSTEIGNSIFDVLEDQGALQVRQLADLGSVPYVFVFQKDMGSITEVIATTPSDTISTLSTIYQNWSEGEWESPVSGPARNWKSMSLSFAERDIQASDSCRLFLYGYESQFGPAVELNEYRAPISEMSTYTFPLNDVDAAQYPYLEARLQFYDIEQRSLPDLRYLYFDYDGSGDVALNPTVAYQLPDSIDQGETINFEIGYENISRTGMDSLLTELQLFNSRNEVTVFQKRQAAIAPGQTNRVTYSIPTEAIDADIRLQLRLNPDEDQPETVLYNNDLNTRIKVGTDVIDPVLQVFFDGRRINDGDLVSGKPEIHVLLRDNNRHLALNDTSGYYLQVVKPDGSEERIAFADSRVEFLPATSSENNAEIYFRPTFDQDGTYTLEVNGSDRSNNFSSRNNYRQAFEVINQQMVANVLTYPNPFTTQTRFVYTLTGNKLPTSFRIQIMTVSGRVVRDIDLLALEDLKIGTHQTDFAWDGTDEYGDQLANGVYLYRVITSDDSGNMLDKYDNGTDQFFAREMGKVVLIR